MSDLRMCDKCGKTARNPYRGVPVEDRAAVSQEWYAFVNLRVEANEDADHGDFCSWQCLAEWAMKKALNASEVSR